MDWVAVVQSGDTQSGRGAFLVKDDSHWGNGSFSVKGWNRGRSVYREGASESISEYPVKAGEGGINLV